MTEYVVEIQVETLSREPADVVKLDAVGGRLATHEVAMRTHDARVWVTVTVGAAGPPDALGMAYGIVAGALDAVGEPGEYRAATVWTGGEYDRLVREEAGD
ncbi:hypothetical protein [Micromonospora coerulea]|uniref:hypothetical protein n=1 Tax=Micromonospora coerulea TaxID=47856 RepID=UPI0019074FFA|nr:hypothetical protein [Micromonospora veneta]